ncbi:hypothetical protein JTE90_024440, partial [Oedothorax gibbosus]
MATACCHPGAPVMEQEDCCERQVKGGPITFHRNLEKDVENFLRVKLQGVRIRLRKGILPHKFECQKPLKVAASTERAAKRQRVSLVNDLLHQPSTSTVVSIIPDASVPDVVEVPGVEVPDFPLSFDKSTQADIKKPYRSKGISCSIKLGTFDVGCQASLTDAPTPVAPSPAALAPVVPSSAALAPVVPSPAALTPVTPSPAALTPVAPSAAVSLEPLSESDSCLSDVDSDYVPEDDPGSDYEPEEDEDEEKKLLRACMVRAVMKDTLMCFGIPQKISFIIDFLAEKSKSPAINVMITLKKIRQNESYAYLAMLFGMSTSNVTSHLFERRSCKIVCPPTVSA